MRIIGRINMRSKKKKKKKTHEMFANPKSKFNKYKL